jgi:hypothetical protein
MKSRRLEMECCAVGSCSETAKRGDAQDQRREAKPLARSARDVRDDCVILMNENDVRVANSRPFQDGNFWHVLTGTFPL